MFYVSRITLTEITVRFKWNSYSIQHLRAMFIENLQSLTVLNEFVTLFKIMLHGDAKCNSWISVTCETFTKLSQGWPRSKVIILICT